MKVYCPECIEEMIKIKIKVGEYVNVRHYECRPYGVVIRIEE